LLIRHAAKFFVFFSLAIFLSTAAAAQQAPASDGATPQAQIGSASAPNQKQDSDPKAQSTPEFQGRATKMRKALASREKMRGLPMTAFFLPCRIS
jgi:hypothetical protein